MSVIFDQAPQGSEAWLEARKGSITASRAKDARDKLRNGSPSSKCLLYAQDVARERCGGKAPSAFVNSAMRTGTTEEPFARMAYEALTGEMVIEAGLAHTEDRKFAVSVDGLIGDDGVFECKTMVSSDTLFTAVVEGDHSAYIDQINFALWLLGRKYCDLALWCPDLPAGQLTVRRIERDDDAIEALEADLIAFERTVSKYEAALRRAMGQQAAPAPVSPLTTVAPLPALPESIFQ